VWSFHDTRQGCAEKVVSRTMIKEVTGLWRWNYNRNANIGQTIGMAQAVRRVDR
jgi:hypothetical protein